MKKRAIKGILLCFITVVLSVGFMTGNAAYAIGGNEKEQAPENVRVIRNSDTSIRIRWTADGNVDGYIIYKYNHSTKQYVKVKTIKDSSVDIWVNKGLKTNKVYKYKVASYKMVDGKKQVSMLSDWVSAKTYKRNREYINAQILKVNSKEVDLGLCSSKKLKCQVKASKYGINKKKKPISTKVRFFLNFGYG